MNVSGKDPKTHSAVTSDPQGTERSMHTNKNIDATLWQRSGSKFIIEKIKSFFTRIETGLKAAGVHLSKFCGMKDIKSENRFYGIEGISIENRSEEEECDSIMKKLVALDNDSLLEDGYELSGIMPIGLAVLQENLELKLPDQKNELETKLNFVKNFFENLADQNKKLTPKEIQFIDAIFEKLSSQN